MGFGVRTASQNAVEVSALVGASRETRDGILGSSGAGGLARGSGDADDSATMNRTRSQVGRAQAGGISLLLAVALLAAAGSGVETARRVAFAGAGLAYAMVADVPSTGSVEGDARATALVGTDKPVRSSPAVERADAPLRTGVLVAGGCIDLPPPSLMV